ncbi:innexin inx3 isoform X2 [Eurytemora carolleeae]|uniref:innexin inx3 isoform X2 n=1 Tax=Eurytemora carolleeae TaxID=1294199 RepID=UPI000C788CC3|nr:innexin inx3 isoform X2 [Eurytemora carolleeae]|eukprot:XP_023330142.1 innexin inx3-like isoform X2 [Eurytemora affinis]
MGLTNPWSDLNFKKLFKRDEIIMDDFVFRLHHQINFFVLGLGVLFIFAENYLDGRAIVCRGADEYANKFCWLHGTGYIGADLENQLGAFSGANSECRMSANIQGLDKSRADERMTSYYIWLPFLLLVCMGLSKLARTLWKEVLEGGLLKDLLLRRRQETICGEKIACEFKLQGKRKLLNYALFYIFCEVLNLLSVLLCVGVFDKILFNRFWSYGSDFITYTSSERGSGVSNPMCEIFPTVVSCSFVSGGSSGGSDLNNHICILSNNLFNMYYFLILWFWWIFLILVSLVQIIYRSHFLGADYIKVTFPWCKLYIGNISLVQIIYR